MIMIMIIAVRGALKKYFLKVKTMAEQGGRGSGPAELSNISKYLSKVQPFA